MKKKDTYNYKGHLTSDRFLKRAFAVMGHMIFAYLLVLATLWVFVFIIMGIVSIFE